jgi:hypothetical protein
MARQIGASIAFSSPKRSAPLLPPKAKLAAAIFFRQRRACREQMVVTLLSRNEDVMVYCLF